jgi:hypothetical protein
MGNFLIDYLNECIDYEIELKNIGYSSGSLRCDRRMMTNLGLKFYLRRRFGKDNQILTMEKMHIDQKKLISRKINGDNREDTNDAMYLQYLVRDFIDFLLYVEEHYFIDISNYYKADPKNKSYELIIDNRDNVSFIIKFTETEIDYIDEDNEFQFKLLDFLNDKKVEEDKVTFYNLTINRKNSYSNEFNNVYPKEFIVSDADKLKFENASYKIRNFIQYKFFNIIDSIMLEYY